MMMQRTKPVPKIKTVKRQKEKTIKEKELRIKPKPRKQKSPRTKLRKACDNAWSAYIHTRDMVCQKCGSNKLLSAHHIIHRVHLSLRWEEENGILLCFHCHIQVAHKDPTLFTDWLVSFKGKEFVDDLIVRSSQSVKFSNKDLIDKTEELKRKKEELDGTMSL
jgi:5-methylcytosine-specific restriction endonuclease McrA